MRNDIPISVRILLFIFLALNALNLGCGGRAEVSSSISEPPSTNTTAGNQIQSPIVGFVSAAGGSELRAIEGVPGASTLSAPLAVPAEVTSLHFAPGQKYALAEQAEGASLGLTAFSGAQPAALVQIPGGISKPEVISFSPHGTAAALYSGSEGRLQVLTGLPDNPQLTRETTSGELPGAVRLLAIADDGVTLLAGTANNAVYLLAGTEPQMLESVTDLGGMVFTPKSNDVLIFDRGAGTLVLMDGVSGARSKRMLAGGLTGLTSNVTLETDGRRAVITTSSANHLWEVDLQSQAVQEVQLPTAPAMLEPLRLSGHYLLAWKPGQPAWILNTNQEKGAVYFVPAAIEAQATLRR